MLNDKSLTAVMSDLSLSHGSKAILNKASCHFHVGDLTFIIGPSGSGKTSIFYIFNRLNDNFPSLNANGNVRLLIDQQWINVFPKVEYSLAALRCKVAMVFQTPHLLPGSVRKNFTLPLKLVRKIPQKTCDAIMEAQLREVCLWDDLKDHLDKSATRLSIGQQQRLCLARALAMEPNFLFLDEPTASLDSESAHQILSLLHRLRERYTIVLVSHNEREWEQYGDRVYQLKDHTLALVR